VDVVTSDDRWPIAQLSDVARLRVLAAGLPGVHRHEAVIEAEFPEVWGFFSDLERSTPLFESDVQSLRVFARDADQWKVRVRLAKWMGSMPLRLDVTMREGWCWMVSRPQFYVIGIAAEPVPGGTLLGYMEGVVLPQPRGTRWLTAAPLALSRWRHRAHVPRDVARLTNLIVQRSER
jgi:hypothetical protein